jgi:hypothetical protein
MNCKKRPDIVTGIAGEAVYELEDASLVAVLIAHERCKISQKPVFVISGRWIDAHGQTKTDAQGEPVVTTYRHASAHEQVALHGLKPLLRACVCLALGEPIETFKTDDDKDVEILPLSHEVKASASIRNAVTAAARTFETINTGDLL